MLQVSLHIIFLTLGLCKVPLQTDFCWLILWKGWIFVLVSADSRSTLCSFQLTLRYISISKNRREFLNSLASVHFWRRLSKPVDNARPHSEWRRILVVCPLWRFGAASLRHVHYLFVWVFVTIYGTNLYCYHWTSSVNPISSIVKTLCEAFYFTCMKHIKSLFEVCRLIDSEFWILYYILVKAYCVTEGTTIPWLLPILLRKSQFYLMFPMTICVLSPILIFSCTMC